MKGDPPGGPFDLLPKSPEAYRADEVLTMIAAICLHRSGGAIEFDRNEWNALVKTTGGAILFNDDTASGGPIRVWLGTLDQANDLIFDDAGDTAKEGTN